MKTENLCRLCAENKEPHDLIHITDTIALNLNLQYKILHCFQLKVEDEDLLPKSICAKCCELVIVTYNFNECIQKAQQTLRSILTGVDSYSSIETSDSKINFIENEQFTVLKKEILKNENCSIVEDNTLADHLLDDELEDKTDDLEDETVIEECNGLNVINTPKRKRKAHFKPNSERLKTSNNKRIRKRNKKCLNSTTEAVTEDDAVSLDLNNLPEKKEIFSNGLVTFDPPVKSWNDYTWICFTCEAQLSSVTELRQHHLSVHNQHAQYRCADCSKPPYSLYKLFVSHVLSHRPALKYCCDLCGSFFRKKDIMEEHRLAHTETKPYSCEKCERRFRCQSALYVHSRSHLPENEKNQYICDVCFKKFATKPNLVIHQRIHSGVKNFTCDQCGKSFIQKGNLDSHLLTHVATRPYKCDLCSKTFKTSLRLKKHATVHSGFKPHKCDICQREFREKSTLKEHLRIHTGDMPYTCEVCGKSFRFKGVLTTHKRQHTGERPYSCLECQHHFTNWPNYNKHMKRRHGVNTSVTVRKPQTIPPTGKPCRNPPGTVIVRPLDDLKHNENANSKQNDNTSSKQTDHFHDVKSIDIVTITDPNIIPCNQVFVAEKFNGEMLNEMKTESNSSLHSEQTPTAVALVGTSVLPPNYYVPSVFGIYNFQANEATQLISQHSFCLFNYLQLTSFNTNTIMKFN